MSGAGDSGAGTWPLMGRDGPWGLWLQDPGYPWRSACVLAFGLGPGPSGGAGPCPGMAVGSGGS